MDKNSALEQMATPGDAIAIQLLRVSTQNQSILAQSQVIMTHFSITPLDTSMQMMMTYPVKTPSPKYQDHVTPVSTQRAYPVSEHLQRS
jgi:hypothetical protein